MPEGGAEGTKHGAETRMYYIICSSPRSGSSLLAEALLDMGIGHPVEYLNPSLIDYQLGGSDNFMVLVKARKKGRREDQSVDRPGGDFCALDFLVTPARKLHGDTAADGDIARI